MLKRVGMVVLALSMVLNAVGSRSLQAASEDEYYELMKLLVETFEQIDKNFVEPVDRRQLVEAAMRGMIMKLDPHSTYIDPDEIKHFNETVDQEFGGIGIQVNIDPKTRQLMVLTPIPGTPAYKAGIQSGDHILEIDGKATADFPIHQEMESAVKMMRGKPGEHVAVKVLHVGTISPETLDIERAVIKTPTVLGDHVQSDGSWSFWIEGEDKIGYIRLTSFGRNSADEFQEVLKMLKKNEMKGLIIDLRFNPGGLLGAAVEISDFFIEGGKVIVSTKGRNTEEIVYKAKRAGTFSGFPIAILVNRFSASASEIVSACLQDHKRAVIVGERTFGKGSVQNVIDLEGGKSALKLTTSSYHRPSGKNIHRMPKATEQDEWGVKPDEGYEVKLSQDEMEKLYESRRQREIVRPKDEALKSDFVDRQLAKGVTYLREQLSNTKPQSDKPSADTPGEKKDEKADSTSANKTSQ